MSTQKVVRVNAQGETTTILWGSEVTLKQAKQAKMGTLGCMIITMTVFAAPFIFVIGVYLNQLLKDFLRGF